MAVPKTKKSKSRMRMRKATTHKRSIAAASTCPSCGESRLPHRVCPACGTYGGRQVLSISVDD